MHLRPGPCTDPPPARAGGGGKEVKRFTCNVLVIYVTGHFFLSETQNVDTFVAHFFWESVGALCCDASLASWDAALLENAAGKWTEVFCSRRALVKTWLRRVAEDQDRSAHRRG